MKIMIVHNIIKTKKMMVKLNNKLSRVVLNDQCMYETNAVDNENGPDDSITEFIHAKSSDPCPFWWIDTIVYFCFVCLFFKRQREYGIFPPQKIHIQRKVRTTKTRNDARIAHQLNDKYMYTLMAGKQKKNLRRGEGGIRSYCTSSHAILQEYK